MEIDKVTPVPTSTRTADNPFRVMEVGHSFAVPAEQYATWQSRSQYWQGKGRRLGRAVRGREELANLTFIWRQERDEQGQPTGQYRCWRIA